MTKKRIDWLDTLRGIAMFFVVWGHCYTNNLGRIRKWIYNFHMPIFFFISGVTYKERDIEPKDFIKKKAKDLLLPYLVFNVVCYVIMAILSETGVIDHFHYLDDFIGIFYSNDEIFRMPCGPSWFLTALFLVEVGFYFLKRFTKDNFQLAVCVIICGLISYSNSISHYQIFAPWHIDSALTGIVFYYLGYLLSKNMNLLDEFMNRKVLAFFTGGFLGLIGVIISVFNRRTSMHANLYGSVTLFYIGCISTIIGLIIFVRLFMKKSVFFKNVGKRTIFYLAYHLPFVFLVIHFYPNLIKGDARKLLFAIYLMIFLFPIAYFVDKYIPQLCGRFKKLK